MRTKRRTDGRTDRHDEAIKMHDDILLNMSFLVSDPGISHVIHSLIRGEANFSTAVGQLLSKPEATGADICDEDDSCINKYAANASISSCER